MEFGDTAEWNPRYREALPNIFKHLKPEDGIGLGLFPKTKDELTENSALTRQLSETEAS